MFGVYYFCFLGVAGKLVIAPCMFGRSQLKKMTVHSQKKMLSGSIVLSILVNYTRT